MKTFHEYLNETEALPAAAPEANQQQVQEVYALIAALEKSVTDLQNSPAWSAVVGYLKANRHGMITVGIMETPPKIMKAVAQLKNGLSFASKWIK